MTFVRYLYVLTLAAVLGLIAAASSAESIVDFPEVIMDLEDVPEEADSGVLVVIGGGFSSFVEKRWLVWTDGDGGVYRLEATLAPAGGIDVRIRSTDPASYDAFETELLELGILDLTNPEIAGTGAPYVTDLPTYDVYFKTGAEHNSFSVRNPAAVGDEYSRIIEAVLGYFEGD